MAITIIYCRPNLKTASLAKKINIPVLLAIKKQRPFKNGGTPFSELPMDPHDFLVRTP